GLTDRENRRILDLLFDQIARPEFTVRFRWETDSLAFWDNRATAHLGPVDLASSDFDRRVERVTITGDLPIGPDGFQSVPRRGERSERPGTDDSAGTRATVEITPAASISCAIR